MPGPHLKGTPRSADRLGMFFQRAEALPCAEGDLVSLRTSLNAPVVATDGAAPSPARAAIAVQRGVLSGLCVSVAVRPLDATGAGALVFQPDVSGQNTETLPTLIEAALAFGESMGFLFDDDELEGADREGRQRATARWNALLEGDLPTESKPQIEVGAVAPPPVSPSFDSDATIDLEGVTIGLEAGAAVAPAVPVAAAGPIAPPPPTNPPLTKFRRAAAQPTPAVAAEPTLPSLLAPAKNDALGAGNASPAPETAARPHSPRGRAPLARLQLIKRTRSAHDRPHTHWLQRLLGSF